MSGEHSSHARLALIPSISCSAESKKESTADPRSGYGGITAKISRLNDILRSLEARRSATTTTTTGAASYGSPQPIWPPTLYNNANLLQTRAAAMESSARAGGRRDGVLNTLSKSDDSFLHTLPSPTIFDNCKTRAGTGSVHDTHPRGGGEFDSHGLHQHGGVLGTLSGDQHEVGGVFDTLARHQLGDTLMRRPHARTHYARVGSVLDTLSRQHASTPSHLDNYAPSSFIRPSSSHINNINHDYCLNYEPFQLYGHLSPPPPPPPPNHHHHFKRPRAPSTELFHGNNEHPGNFLNVAEMAQDILGRLQRLEMQKAKKKKQLTLSKKGSMHKGGGNSKMSRQRKVDGFGEKSLLQLVRRRCRELCIDNEQFRDEQRRLTQRFGPPHQWGDANGHAKSSYNLHKTKDDWKTKKRGKKSTTYLDDSLVQANDSSG